jgi:hypothetical protein
MSSIRVYDITDLAELAAKLVKLGVVFTAAPDGASFIIKFTGGY